MTGKVSVRFFCTNPADFDHAGALARLEAVERKERYVERPQGRRLFAIPLWDNEGIGLWSLRSDAPDVHLDGDIRPWDLDGEVAEGSYFRFLAHGLMAMAPTGHGPRTTALSAYFDEITDDDVVFDPIVRSATSAYVASLDEVKRIEFGVTDGSVGLLREVDDTLGRAVAELASATGSKKLNIILDGSNEDERLSMWARMRGAVRDLAARDDIDRLRRAKVIVKGEVGGEEDIDLLKDRIAYQIPVPAEGVDQQNAFGVIAQAYDRFRADFDDRAG